MLTEMRQQAAEPVIPVMAYHTLRQVAVDGRQTAITDNTLKILATIHGFSVITARSGVVSIRWRVVSHASRIAPALLMPEDEDNISGGAALRLLQQDDERRLRYHIENIHENRT